MTPNQLRSVSGYTGLMIAPIEDGNVRASDLVHIAGFFALALTIGALSASISVVPSLGAVPDVGTSIQSTPALEAAVSGKPLVRPK